MFGKRKCDAPPVFKDTVQAGSAEDERKALAALQCASGASLTPVAVEAPSPAALLKAAKLTDAVWLHGHRLECSRCKKTCSVTVGRPAGAAPPSDRAVRSKARPDFYALQHAFLPEWFLNRPADAISILTTKLDGWQAATMKQIGTIVERSPGDPMPIQNVRVVGTPGETTSLLIDFLPPCAPIEAHHALLVGGSRPRFFLSEKTHLGDERPLTDMAGLTEWTFGKADKSDMKHTAIDLLPEVSRKAFYNSAVELLIRSLA